MGACNNRNSKHCPTRPAFAIVCLGAIFLSFQSGCKRGPTEPGSKNPREYTWTIDTLQLDPVKYSGPWQILLQSIWGTTSDLYAVGHSDGTAGVMWHFDGKKWSNVRLAVFEGGTIPAPFDLSAIHGLASDNIYAVGQRYGPTSYGTNFIIHFDGKKWEEEQTPYGYGLLSVWARAYDDIWACGLNGTVLHYDGLRWKYDTVAVPTPEGSQFYFASIAAYQDEIFMIGSAYQISSTTNKWTYYFCRRPTNVWTIDDTFERDLGDYGGKWGGAFLSVLSSGSMYSVDNYGVFQWIGGRWIVRYRTTKNTESVFGTRDDNLFVTGSNGLVAQYNGTDWYEYSGLAQPNVVYSGGWANEGQVILLGWVSGLRTIVLRGR